MKLENPRHSSAIDTSIQLATLSPLDQIRQSEAEVTREVVQAHEAAGKIVKGAHDQAAQTLQQARTAGENEGQARYKEMLIKSEEEATALVAGARQQADGLRQTGTFHMEALVGRIVRFVTGMEEGV